MNVGLLASKAAVALLNSADPALSTVTHFYAEASDPEDTETNSAIVRLHPCAVCYFTDAHEYPALTGNYNGNLTIQIEASADDHTAAQFEAMFDEVWGFIVNDDIITRLSDVGEDFTAHGFWAALGQTDQTVNNRLRQKAIILPINCCPRDIL